MFRKLNFSGTGTWTKACILRGHSFVRMTFFHDLIRSGLEKWWIFKLAHPDKDFKSVNSIIDGTLNVIHHVVCGPTND